MPVKKKNVERDKQYFPGTEQTLSSWKGGEMHALPILGPMSKDTPREKPLLSIVPIPKGSVVDMRALDVVSGKCEHLVGPACQRKCKSRTVRAGRLGLPRSRV